MQISTKVTGLVKAEVNDDIFTADLCMKSYAVRAARLSRFSADSNAGRIELGEIVYEFNNTGNSAINVCYSGEVVVEIWVDNYGNVQKAVSGAEGTTLTDKTLWQAARKAALAAHFNMSADVPALQKGSIIYMFDVE